MIFFITNASDRIQLITKGIIRPDEWDLMKQDIRFDFQEDNHFAELRDNELLNQRIDTLAKMEQYIGRYFSIEYVRRHVLMQSEDDVKEIDQQMKDEQQLHIQNAEFQADVNAAKNPVQTGEPE